MAEIRVTGSTVHTHTHTHTLEYVIHYLISNYQMLLLLSWLLFVAIAVAITIKTRKASK